MEKKRIHLIANAHLDPVWLWRWEEGCTEALSTFLTASELLDEFEEFRFNHNESLLYEWVKKLNPELYSRIQRQVKEKKWEITGGWFLQPDCNLPSGESMIRNILFGRIFFKKEFGIVPRTAVNYDSFGHSRGLVQILKLAGYENYLVYRPGRLPFPDSDFIWEGLDGSQILVHRSDEGYNSVFGQAAQKVEEFAEKRKHEPVSLCLWGIGDHGGGPSRKDLKDLRALKCMEENEVIHSTPDEYFEECRREKKPFPVAAQGLNPVCEGCYTSQIRVKQKHRALENEIYSVEKMCTAASLLLGRPYPEKEISEAVKALIFSEFHDALPGSGSQPVEEDTLRLLDHGLELAAREKLYAAIALSAGQPKAKPDTGVILIYNPHPYDVEGVFTYETGLPYQNWGPDYKYPKVLMDGMEIPAQAEKEDSNFMIDWRKKITIRAVLKASYMNRLDISYVPLEKRPAAEPIISLPYFDFTTSELSVQINTGTGLIDRFAVKGTEYLGEGSGQLQMTDDGYNPWGFGTGESACTRNFQLLSAYEASEFCGFRDQVLPPVRIIEDGSVRTVVEAVFGLLNSRAYVRYKLPKKGTGFEVEVLVHFAQQEQSLKLMLNLSPMSEQGDMLSLLGQIMFGRETLPTDGRECAAQRWVMAEAGERALAVVNDGTYGLNCRRNRLGLTLLRSAGYTAAESSAGKPFQEGQYTPRMEQGVRRYSFAIEAGEKTVLEETADRIAQIFNEKPYGFSFCPPGTGQKCGTFLTIDQPDVLVSALKKAEESDRYLLRIYEAAGKPAEAQISVSALQIREKVSLRAFEIKTFWLDAEERKLTEASLLEEAAPKNPGVAVQTASRDIEREQ